MYPNEYSNSLALFSQHQGLLMSRKKQAVREFVIVRQELWFGLRVQTQKELQHISLAVKRQI